VNWRSASPCKHEILPRVSLEWGPASLAANFTVRDNLSVLPSDFTSFSVTAPVRSSTALRRVYGFARGLYDVNPAKSARPITTSLSAGLRDDLAMSSTARTSVSPPDPPVAATPGRQQHWAAGDRTMAGFGRSCRSSLGLVLSTARFPRQPNQSRLPLAPGITTRFHQRRHLHHPELDVIVSRGVPKHPGSPLRPTWNVPSATSALTLGRPLGERADFVVNLLSPGQMWSPRVNDLDTRSEKSCGSARHARLFRSTCIRVDHCTPRNLQRRLISPGGHGCADDVLTHLRLSLTPCIDLKGRGLRPARRALGSRLVLESERESASCRNAGDVLAAHRLIGYWPVDDLTAQARLPRRRRGGHPRRKRSLLRVPGEEACPCLVKIRCRSRRYSRTSLFGRSAGSTAHHGGHCPRRPASVDGVERPMRTPGAPGPA